MRYDDDSCRLPVGITVLYRNVEFNHSFSFCRRCEVLFTITYDILAVDIEQLCAARSLIVGSDYYRPCLSVVCFAGPVAQYDKDASYIWIAFVDKFATVVVVHGIGLVADISAQCCRTRSNDVPNRHLPTHTIHM